MSTLDSVARRTETCPPRDVVFRLLVSIVADDIGKRRKRSVEPAEWSAWGLSTTIDEDGVGVDSLGRLDLVGRVNEFFHMHEVGSEDYLVVRRTLGDWVEIVEATLARRHERLTFQTSGSSGVPKSVVHEVAALNAEIDAFAAILSPPTRVIACPPPHHLYGFLFTVLAPLRFGADVLDARLAAPSVLRRAEPGDLVVATPHQWGVLLRGLGEARLPDGVVGVSSSAPTPPALWRDAAAAGLSRMVEVFGSTETAGVGWRDAAAAPFSLLPTWRKSPARDDLIRWAEAPEKTAETPDRLEWIGDDRFRPLGRVDGAVQIGGVNVFPSFVEDVLKRHDLVADCAVRPVDDGAETRLKAFVVLTSALDRTELGAAGAEPVDALAALDAHCRERLSAVERPLHFTFGAALPRNAMGKLADWS